MITTNYTTAYEDTNRAVKQAELPILIKNLHTHIQFISTQLITLEERLLPVLAIEVHNLVPTESKQDYHVSPKPPASCSLGGELGGMLDELLKLNSKLQQLHIRLQL